MSAGFFFLFRSIGVQTRVIDTSINTVDAAGIASRIATAVQIPFFYFRKLSVPIGFAPEYDVTFATSLADPAVLAALTGLLAMFAVAWRIRATFPELLFCLGWIVATMLPVMNFLPTYPIVSDRYAYLPSFGFMYLLASCLIRPKAGLIRTMVLVCGVLLMTWWSITAVIRNTAWKSEKTLWQDAITTTPRHVKAYVGLGNVLLQERDYDNALRMFAKADELGSRYNHYDFHQGIIHISKGELPAAVVSLNKALQKNQNHIEALYNLGSVYVRLGESERALECYKKVLTSPEPDIHGTVPLAREAQQRVVNAYMPRLDAIRKRVADNPRDWNVRAEQAALLEKYGLYEEALTSYLDMEKGGVAGWQLFYNIATIYKKLGNGPEAARYFEKSLVLNPNFTDCLNNLGIVYKEMKRYKRAIEVFERAIASNDSFAYAPYNIATTYMLMGDRSNALRYFTYTEKKFPQLKDKIAPFMKELEK
jgi:tetratricopeptide (TPR) repeat protein